MFKNRLGKILVILIAVILASGTVYAAGQGSSWLSAGHDIQNTRYQSAGTKITSSNAGNLTVKWQFVTGGDVSATPALDGTNVYFPDWAGNLYALDQKTGAVVWSHQISEYTGVLGDLSRVTPAVFGNMLILGNQATSGGGAKVMAVNKKNGNLIWVTQAESHFASLITQSAVVDSTTQIAYVGVSSREEGLAAFIPGYQCCSFRGSMLALNANTGQILWKTYIVPMDFSGGAVWGSTPVLDNKRGSVYITTGNNYSVSQEFLDCTATHTVQECMPVDNHIDSVMALDLMTGAIKWSFTALLSDAWNVDCILGNENGNCPTDAGPDYDFGQGAALYAVKLPNGGQRDLLGAGQKSGDYWALDPNTGAVVWKTNVGPGGTLGGLEWGSATDGKRIYAAIANNSHKPWLLANGQTVNSGGWSALDAATGQILWQTPDPMGDIDPGAVSAASDIVFGCSLEPTAGSMYAMNAATGNILWSFASGGSCNSGAAISGNVVYWGTGYSNLGLGTPKNMFYAFSVP